MLKVLNLEIDCCDFCPYCHHNGGYGRSYGSGYDCHHPEAPVDARIADDHEIKRHSLMIIPEWCPLETKGEKDV